MIRCEYHDPAKRTVCPFCRAEHEAERKAVAAGDLIDHPEKSIPEDLVTILRTMVKEFGR